MAYIFNVRHHMKIKLIQLTILLLALSSCEYFNYYEYKIENQVNDTITIVGGRLMIDYALSATQDSILVVLPNETLRIYSHSGGVAGKDEEPEDIRGRYWDIDTVLIGIRDTVLIKNFGESSIWKYKAGPNIGIYTLSITEDLLKD